MSRKILSYIYSYRTSSVAITNMHIAWSGHTLAGYLNYTYLAHAVVQVHEFRVSTFGGMEWWNGILEYWNGIAKCAQQFFSCV